MCEEYQEEPFEQIEIQTGCDPVDGWATIDQEMLEQLIHDANCYHELKRADTGSLGWSNNGWVSAGNNGEDWGDLVATSKNPLKYLLK